MFFTIIIIIIIILNTAVGLLSQRVAEQELNEMGLSGNGLLSQQFN
jgi:hypothetical protein